MQLAAMTLLSWARGRRGACSPRGCRRAAGCVLAARLSESGAARVLLLEAGGRQPLEAMSVPPA